GYLDALENHNAALEAQVADLEQKLEEAAQSQPPGATPSDVSDLSDSLTERDIDVHPSTSTSAGCSTSLANDAGDASTIHASSDEAASTVFTQATAASTTATEATPAGDDAANMELLCLRSVGADPHYFGASSTYSFKKVFSASLRAIRTQAPGLSMSGYADSGIQFRPKSNPVPLPGRSFTTMLTSAYFDQVHPQFPFIHQPTYLQWENEVLEACEGGYSPDPAQAFFVYYLSAVGALTGPLAGGNLPEVRLFASAEGLFEHVIKLNTLESIQAILCCAMYSIRSPVVVSVWHRHPLPTSTPELLSGLALRQCTELGLHRKITWNKIDSNCLKTQIRRRVFWCCYSLDRAVAVSLGRPQGISDGDIDVEFPLDIDDINVTPLGTAMSAAIHTLRLRRIWAKIQRSIYPQVSGDADATRPCLIDGLKRELDDWLDSSPAQFLSTEAHNNAFGSREWFEGCYHHSILLLHRRGRHCAGWPTCRCRAARPSRRRRGRFGARAARGDSRGCGVTFIYCLWSSGEACAHFRVDAVLLSIIAERWACAVPYRNAFDMLARATMAMLVENLAAAAAATPPLFPVLRSPENDQPSSYISHMAEVGIGASVEDLLATMLHHQ
ncbi:fungal-specific transcription factor domain-containing protein, partial [Massariosphaeria phaeospora]